MFSVIVPAYNEEKTIHNIIMELKRVPFQKEIIVVNDGSHDNTAKISQETGVFVVNLEKNHGKAYAMQVGIRHSREDNLLFVDADLIGFKKEHALELLHPIITGEAEMTVGVFAGGRHVTDLSQKITPYLSGQRAMKKAIFSSLSNVETLGYGIEVALTRLAMVLFQINYKYTCLL